MTRKRPLEVVTAAEAVASASAPGTPLSPSKRLRRAGLVMMWLRRRPRPIAGEQMAALLIQQMQVETVKMFMLLMVLVVRLGTVERLLLEQPSLLQTLFEERFAAFQRSFMGAIQDMIRTAVRSEVHERQATLLSKAAYQHPRSTISEGLPQTEGGTKIVKLLFVDVERPEDPLFTGSPVKWQNGANAKVAIFENGSQITQGDLSKLQIEILAVHDDFFTERGPGDFTKEEFNKQIYMCKGKESVLTTVNLTNGEAYIGSFFFTESSYGKKLRLAARVKCQDLAVRVQEATSHSFVVKHCRSKSNKKSYTPSKEEGVHCLKKIAPKGKHYNDLKGKNITKVKHLMRHYHRDQAGLQKLTGMKNEEWNTMIKHAATSDPGDEIYSYSVPEENVVLFFNDFFDLTGMSVGDFYTPYNTNKLDQLQQRKVNNWKRSAHKKFEDQEKLGSLIPDYAMSNGLPVLVSPNDASPSIQARPTFQCSDYQRALQEFGQTHRYNDAGPSTQGKQLLQQYAYGQKMHQESGQQDPSLQLNENSNHLNQENILIDQSSIPAQLNTPSHNTLAVQEDDLITGANLSVRHNGNLSSLTTDAAGTSHPVTDGANLMNEYGQIDEVFMGLSPIGEWVEPDHGHMAYQGFLPDNNETASSNNQFNGHEYDGGNWKR